MAISIGRMSCLHARSWSITNMFSLISLEKAGMSFGIIMGIACAELTIAVKTKKQILALWLGVTIKNLLR